VTTLLGVEDEVTGLRLGGWWRRVGAAFSDNVILLLPSYAMFALFGAVGGLIVGFLASVALRGIYQVRLLGTERGQTIGNRIAVTCVRDATTGNPLTRQQSTRRWLFIALYQVIASVLAGRYALPVLLVFMAADDLYPLFNARNQTLHDRFANTIVVMA
jgi:uncharacterized RDD family membrane protein YckC